MRAPILFSIAVLACAGASAQTPASPAVAPAATPSAPVRDGGAPPSRHNQRIERIQGEDGGNRIEELRVGGQTQTITVQPKGGSLPSYEVKPGNAGKDGMNATGSDGTNGRRVWNISF